MNENLTPKKPQPELSETDAELLSAYLDNMLDAQERAALEARLQTDAFLRSELAAMRQMLGWLKTMPTLKAPRNFTLTEADVKPKVIAMPRRNNWQVAGAAAAVFIALLGFAYFAPQFLDLAPKADHSNIALQSTDVQREQEATLFFAATAMPLPMATMGIPPEGNAGGAPIDESAEAADMARSSDVAAYNAEIPATGAESANELEAPESPVTTDGIVATNGGDGSITGEFGGGNADESSGGQADTQMQLVMPTTTAISGSLVAMPTMTMQASPPPTLSAAIVTQEAVAQEESMEMSVMVESTQEEIAVMSAPAEDSDDFEADSAETGIAASSRISISERLNTLLGAILSQIREEAQR